MNMTNSKYTDEQQDTFLELAEEVGISRAMRQLGYPKSWSTANNWADAKGVKVAIDEIKARATDAREWYKDQDVRLVAETGLSRVAEELTHTKALLPDDHKKLSEAGTKWFAIWQTVQGKANQISETRQSDSFGDLMKEFEAHADKSESHHDQNLVTVDNEEGERA